MTSYRWKTSVTNGNWNVDGNWTTSGYPGGGVPETDVAVLPAKLGRIGFYTVTVPASTLIDLLRLAIGGSSGVFHVTNLDVNGILNTDTLAYVGASNHANIDIGVGGKLDIRTTLNSGDPQTLSIEATGTGGFGTGGYLQLGSALDNGFATGLVNANVTFGFHNNPTGINSGVIEYLSGFINGGTVTAAQHVTNLAWGDGFIVDGDNFTGASFVINSGTLHVTTTSSSVINFTHLDLAGLTAANFVGAGDDIEIICYVRGTRILTPQGERAIEALAPGDPVVTATGETLAVKWVGHRRLSLAGHPRPQTVAPVRILRGAVADNMPHRDLLVSPDHALFVDGKLICARQLVNGTTIRQEGDWPTVEYYHVELDRHAIVLAEGLPAESYIDTGNSGFFANADAPLRLHPDLTDESDYPTREAGSCAPFVWDEASVRPVWEGLADRAASIGLPVPRRETTTQAELRLRAKGTAGAARRRGGAGGANGPPRPDRRLVGGGARRSGDQPLDRRRGGAAAT
jgi:Hint domain